MNTGDTGMKTLKEVLALIQGILPKLYKEKIRGQWPVLIAEAEERLLEIENKYPNLKEREASGRINPPLKFLLALAILFGKLADEMYEKHTGLRQNPGPAVYCSGAHSSCFSGISRAFLNVFWDTVLKHPSVKTQKQDIVMIRHDWSFVVYSADEFPHMHTTQLDIFLSSLEDQLWTISLLEVVDRELSEKQPDLTEHF